MDADTQPASATNTPNRRRPGTRAGLRLRCLELALSIPSDPIGNCEARGKSVVVNAQRFEEYVTAEA